MPANTLYSWESVSFDSDIFGFNVAKITDIKDPTKVTDLIAELQSHQIQYATYRLPANCFPVIHALEKSGFILVDGLIKLTSTLEKKSPSFIDINISTQDPHIRLVTIDDIPKLRSLASTVFSLNRFYNDPVIPKQKADELFATWIENSVKGQAADETYILSQEDNICGFITLQKKGHIPLVGVGEEYRGQGIAKQLVQCALARFKELDISTIEIETQIINTPAVRAYQACGFKFAESFLTFRWTSL
jgi:dTDP-4-amino-4,6-dideoxy-D-galactose acyltransferase